MGCDLRLQAEVASIVALKGSWKNRFWKSYVWYKNISRYHSGESTEPKHNLSARLWHERIGQGHYGLSMGQILQWYLDRVSQWAIAVIHFYLAVYLRTFKNFRAKADNGHGLVAHSAQVPLNSTQLQISKLGINVPLLINLSFLMNALMQNQTRKIVFDHELLLHILLSYIGLPISTCQLPFITCMFATYVGSLNSFPHIQTTLSGSNLSKTWVRCTIIVYGQSQWKVGIPSPTKRVGGHRATKYPTVCSLKWWDTKWSDVFPASRRACASARSGRSVYRSRNTVAKMGQDGKGPCNGNESWCWWKHHGQLIQF